MNEAPFSHSEFVAFLDDISQPFMTRQIDRWAARIILPFSLVSSAGPVTLTSQADVERNFELYLAATSAMGMDLIFREPVSFEHCEDGTVLATYRTNLIGHGKRLTSPYTSTALLHPKPTRWKMSAILNARGHHEWTGRFPLNTGE